MKTTVRRPAVIRSAEIPQIVKDIILYKLGLDENKLHDEARFQDDLGVDSLDLIELQMEIEKEFGISITDEEAENMTTVGSIIACIQRKR
jgi:acyl carrier protein